MRAVGWLYMLALVSLAGAQMLLGADPWVLSVLLAIAATALVPVVKGGWRISDGLFALMTVYFGSASLIVKTLARQPVQMNLQVPDLSAAYLLAGFASISLGYLMSQFIRRPSHFAGALNRLLGNPEKLSAFALPVFMLGAIALFLQTQFRPLAGNGGFEGGGFGGFGTFYPLLVLGAAMQTALAVRRPRQTRHIIVLGAMAAVILILTLADNTKRTLFDFLFVVGLTAVSLQMRPRWRWIGAGLVAGAAALALIAPAIQIVRAQADARGLDRVAATATVLRDYEYNPLRLAEAADRIATGYELAWRDSYVFPRTWNTERFTMIQPIDQVARALDERGTIGGDDLWRDPAETLLPGFLLDKSLATAPDRIAWHYGFRANGSIARPVVGLVASSLAAFGLAGVLLLPALTVAFTFGVLDYAGGRLRGNAWAAFLLAVSAFLAEREVSTTLSFFCRNFPFILLAGATLILIGGRRSKPVRVIPVNEMPL